METLEKRFVTIRQIMDDISLTPFQKKIEVILLTKSVHQQREEIFRLMATMLDAMKSRQHWAGDHYTQYLIECGENIIKEIETKPH